MLKTSKAVQLTESRTQVLFACGLLHTTTEDDTDHSWAQEIARIDSDKRERSARSSGILCEGTDYVTTWF